MATQWAATDKAIHVQDHSTEEEGDAVLTIVELSSYLKIPKSTLYKLVRSGSIPAVKIGKHWRFHKAAIDKWLMNRDSHLNSDA